MLIVTQIARIVVPPISSRDELYYAEFPELGAATNRWHSPTVSQLSDALDCVHTRFRNCESRGGYISLTRASSEICCGCDRRVVNLNL
mgnify:CR=1 FL=1|jgi:hypothetical protein